MAEEGRRQRRGPKDRARLELADALRQADRNMRVLRGKDGHLPAGELGQARFELLTVLEEHEPISSGDLALRAGFSGAAISRMLDPLVADKFVERARSEADRRVVIVFLTDKGRDAVEERRRFWEDRWTAALRDVDLAELEIATTLMWRIAALFDLPDHEGRRSGPP